VLFHPKALAHIQIISSNRNARGVLYAITHQHVTMKMALQDSDIIITAVRTVDQGINDIKENKSRERRKIHSVLVVYYIGQAQKACRRCERNLKRRIKV